MKGRTKQDEITLKSIKVSESTYERLSNRVQKYKATMDDIIRELLDEVDGKKKK
jgi:macrodomain Ter protein organizer (MatP/YcbG family)